VEADRPVRSRPREVQAPVPRVIQARVQPAPNPAQAPARPVDDLGFVPFPIPVHSEARVLTSFKPSTEERSTCEKCSFPVLITLLFNIAPPHRFFLHLSSLLITIHSNHFLDGIVEKPGIMAPWRYPFNQNDCGSLLSWPWNSPPSFLSQNQTRGLPRANGPCSSWRNRLWYPC
jgi:hypothetical protein